MCAEQFGNFRPNLQGWVGTMGRQFLQLAKCFQTMVRLGTYTGKVPDHNCLKACKGSVFFLPLPHNKTIETMDDVANKLPESLPSPKLFIIISGLPTKSSIVWRSIVDVNHIRAAKIKQTAGDQLAVQ